jgi:hypothetical protein
MASNVMDKYYKNKCYYEQLQTQSGGGKQLIFMEYAKKVKTEEQLIEFIRKMATEKEADDKDILNEISDGKYEVPDSIFRNSEYGWFNYSISGFLGGMIEGYDILDSNAITKPNRAIKNPWTKFAVLLVYGKMYE